MTAPAETRESSAELPREARERQAMHNVNHCTKCRDWGAWGERHEDHAPNPWGRR